MPAVGTTQNSMMPSIGQILGAISPKNLVSGLALISGISNISGAPARHGGGLQTAANARFNAGLKPQIAACLNEPWVHQFPPERAIVACTLQELRSWELSSDDPYASDVISRSVANLKLGTYSPVPSGEGPTLNTAKQVSHKAHAIVRGSNEFQRIMERAERQYRQHSSRTLDDMSNPTQPFTADDMITALEDDVGVDSFKKYASYLSFRMNTMMSRAGNQLYALKPELVRSQSDRAAFKMEVNKHFASARDTLMDDHQLRRLLSVLASYINDKHSLRTS